MGIDARMLLVNRGKPFTEDEVLSLSYKLCCVVGHDWFMLWRPDNEYGYPAQHALSIVSEYRQDGPTLRPKDGEQFIQVRLGMRYYGIGYERGPILKIIEIATVLEYLLPECEILYGGDSSGVLAEPFTTTVQQELVQHYLGTAAEDPYGRYFDEGFSRGEKFPFDRPTCDLCKVPMIRSGWGQGFAAFHCAGCGHRVETRDSGKTWVVSKKGW